MKKKQASFENHETKMMNFREKIEKIKLLQFQNNPKDADCSVKAAGRRFERDRNFRQASPIFLKENLRRRMIFGVCPQSVNSAGFFLPAEQFKEV